MPGRSRGLSEKSRLGIIGIDGTLGDCSPNSRCCLAAAVPGQSSGLLVVAGHGSPLLPSLGIMIMMTLCDQVDIYEFLPSRRKTDVCYYHQKFFDSACTMGAYHPLLFEKNMVKQLNEGTDEDIYIFGKATLSGFRSIHC